MKTFISIPLTIILIILVSRCSIVDLAKCLASETTTTETTKTETTTFESTTTETTTAESTTTEGTTTESTTTETITAESTTTKNPILPIEPFFNSSLKIVDVSGLSNIQGVSVTNDYVFIASLGANTIRKYDLNGVFISETSVTNPYAMSNYLDDKILAVENYKTIITVDNSLNKETKLSGFTNVYGIYYDSVAKRLYVADQTLKQVFIYGEAFNPIDSFTITSTGTIYAIAAQSDIIYLGFNQAKIEVYQDETLKNSYTACTATASNIRNFYIDVQGNKLVTECINNNQLALFDISGSSLTKTTSLGVGAVPRQFTFDKLRTRVYATYSSGFKIITLA